MGKGRNKRKNAAFEDYYKTQKIVSDKQWDPFMIFMRKRLPVSFRIDRSKIEANRLLEIIQRDFFNDIQDQSCKIYSKSKEGEIRNPVVLRCLPFYPDCLAWQLRYIRRNLHKFLVTEEYCGNLIRQDVVSMIPPLLLDIKPSHKVLDMCAGIGLNTYQLIEMLHSDMENDQPKGFVIANEFEIAQCHSIVNQAKFRNSPNTLVTNHDATSFPNLKFTTSEDVKENLKYDRILADVPCSEDGTMRGNPTLWRRWSPAHGNEFHEIQYKIARRGLVLLAVGGRMVYSSCSLNPIENEAVLHRLLLETGDSVRIVDGRDLVPGLVCDPGLSHWYPATKELAYYESWEDVPVRWPTQLQESMFPPNEEDAEKFHFERCMRILPHQQDTGGIFMAILEKVKPLPWESSENESGAKEDCEKLDADEEANYDEYEDVEEYENVEGDEDTEDERNKSLRKKKRPLSVEHDPPNFKKGFKNTKDFTENRFVFLKDDPENDYWMTLKKFYDITDELDTNLLVRDRRSKKKFLHYMSPEIRNIVVSNKDQVKLISIGIKLFILSKYQTWINQDGSSRYRLTLDGLKYLINYISDNKKFPINREDLITVLLKMRSNAGGEEVTLDPDTEEYLNVLKTGSWVLVYEETGTDYANPLKLNIIGFEDTIPPKLHNPAHLVKHYLRLLGEDCSIYERNKAKDRAKEIEVKTQTESADEETSDDDSSD